MDTRGKDAERTIGAQVQAGIEHFLNHRFQTTPIRVDVVVATGSRNGGYTDTQTVLPSWRADYQGLAALEMLYHEATHIDVADKVTEAIDAELKAKHRSGDSLWHAVQFYTVGELQWPCWWPVPSVAVRGRSWTHHAAVAGS